MSKKYVTYKQHGKIKKAVLDENLFNKLLANKTAEEICEYDNEMLMERKFAEKLGVSDTRKTLLG